LAASLAGTFAALLFIASVGTAHAQEPKPPETASCAEEQKSAESTAGNTKRVKAFPEGAVPKAACGLATTLANQAEVKTVEVKLFDIPLEAARVFQKQWLPLNQKENGESGFGFYMSAAPATEVFLERFSHIRPSNLAGVWIVPMKATPGGANEVAGEVDDTQTMPIPTKWESGKPVQFEDRRVGFRGNFRVAPETDGVTLDCTFEPQLVCFVGAEFAGHPERNILLAKGLVDAGKIKAALKAAFPAREDPWAKSPPWSPVFQSNKCRTSLMLLPGQTLIWACPFSPASSLPEPKPLQKAKAGPGTPAQQRVLLFLIAPKS
jgi:hypothetical protein